MIALGASGVADDLERVAGRYAITTRLRVCHWLAQLAHESAGFTRTVENLNYSADALLRTWPSRFDAESAARAARQPERIANTVYADRLGNGPRESGDGWAFRGRGFIQLTGRLNYVAASLAIYSDDRLVKRPELAASPAGAADVAGWYWSDRRINRWADHDDIEAVTKAVNGGVIGLADRKERLRKALAAFDAEQAAAG